MKTASKNFIGRPVAMSQAGLLQLFGGFFDDMPTAEAKCPVETVDGVAVIGIAGIVEKDPLFSFWTADVDKVREAVEAAAADDGVQAIVLDFDSPGGGVCGVPELADAIAAVGKPVVAYTDSEMCSAAYWMAAGADAILAAPSAAVGSVGCYCAIVDTSAAATKEGIKVNLIASGTFKGAGYPGTPVSDEQLALFRDRVVEVAEEFKAHVRAHREVADEDLEGQAFSGRKAEENGMIDALGSLDDAIALASTLATMKKE